MSITEKLSQQQFKALLEDIYTKGQESKTIKPEEIIKEIQNKLTTLLEIPNKQ